MNDLRVGRADFALRALGSRRGVLRNPVGCVIAVGGEEIDRLAVGNSVDSLWSLLFLLPLLRDRVLWHVVLDEVRHILAHLLLVRRLVLRHLLALMSCREPGTDGQLVRKELRNVRAESVERVEGAPLETDCPVFVQVGHELLLFEAQHESVVPGLYQASLDEIDERHRTADVAGNVAPAAVLATHRFSRPLGFPIATLILRAHIVRRLRHACQGL
mmetsp:Transcript_6083/g.24228  ORF Transcript_6083/g.24228 Transcript_6083/m.24228 type:complete len:216 (-) Transcript_6083:1475-2122(-)